MNIMTLKWDPTLLSFFKILPEILPEIRSSSEIYGYIQDELLQGVPISGVCNSYYFIKYNSIETYNINISKCKKICIISY